MKINVFTICFLIFSNFVFSQSPTINSIQVFQIDVEVITPIVNNSDVGLMSFDVTPNTDDKYLNVIAQYGGVPTIPDWSIQNLYIPDASHYAAQHKIAQRIDLTPFGITNGTNMNGVLNMQFYLTDLPIPDFASLPPVATGNANPNVGSLDEAAENSAAGDNAGAGSPPGPPSQNPDNGDPVTKCIYRGCAVPNIELDNSNFPAGSGYAGDKNACAPVSAANSLLWMRNKFAGQFDDIPSDERTLLNELSGYMNRAANSGTPLDDFVKGKLDFIKDKGLNIQVKFQSDIENSDIYSGDVFAQNQNDGDYPIWDWLVNEMEEMEDVEMWFRWYDAGAEKWRDHMVVVTGVEERGDGTNVTRRTVKFKHDTDQDNNDPDDNVQETADIFIDSEGRMNFKLQNGRPAYVRTLVSESPGEPFPVELNLFEGKYIDDLVLLNWETATEINNYGFEIERVLIQNEPTDASSSSNITEGWVVLGFVQGHGNSNSPKKYEFVDNNLNKNGNYFYRLKQIDNDGSYEYSNIIEISILESLPSEFALIQNYPNPFNPTTKISYSIPEASFVTLKIYGLLGREISTLVNEEKQAGSYKINFDADRLSSGIYFYKIESGNYVETKKMMLIK